MKNGIVGEIKVLRKGGSIRVDYRNANRYRLVLQEENGSSTAYCFSTPIYNLRTGKILDFAFHQSGGVCYSAGSGSSITVSEDVLLENAEGYCRASLRGKPVYHTPGELRTGRETLYPAANGVAYKVRCSSDAPYRLRVSVGRPFLQIRENRKCFALMREEFQPYLSVSSIGAVNAGGQVIAPAELAYEKASDREYILYIKPCCASAAYVMFEVNLYEPKLFQDTTVESENPGMNNAFGGIAFLGNTRMYGEQWLYTRPDFSKMPEMLDRQVRKAVWHLPKLGGADVRLTAHEASARFCSFGSNWTNKIAAAALETESCAYNGYVDLDVTHILTDSKTGFIKRSEGWVVRTKVKGSGFAAVATGDSYYAPQILELNFQ